MISDKKNKYINFENIFPFILETIEDLFIIVSLDNSFKIEYIHECKFLEQLGYSECTLLGKSLLNLVDFGNKSPKTELLEIIHQNKNIQDVKVIKKNGELTWVEFISTLFNDEKNQQKLIVKLRDISKRKELEKNLQEIKNHLEKISKTVPEIRFWEIFRPKKYEQALKESEALLNTAIECLPFDIFMINKDGYYAMQNSTSKEFWGDIIGKRPEEVANDQETLAIWKDNNSRAFSGEMVTGEVKFKINGNYHHLYNIVSPVYINDEIQFIIGVNIDVTELKSTEQKLEESEERYREMIDNLDVGFFRVSLDGTILIHNRKCNEIFGISPLERRIGEKTLNFWKNQEDREKYLINLMKTGYVKNYVALAKKINGKTIILQINSHLINDDKGIPIAAEGTIIEITEKYNLQRGLEESEKKYRDIAELLPDILFETDLNLNLTYVNSIAYNIFGYNEEDVRSGLNITQFIDPKYKEKAMKNIKLLLENKETTPQEYLLVKKDGRKFFALIHSKPVYINKIIIGIRGTITDINNLIIAEQDLKESEDKFRTIAEQSLMGICIIQDFEIKYFNQQMAEIYGYPIDEIKQWKPKEFIKVIHPDFTEMVINQITKKQQGSKDVITHYIAKIIKKNGEIRYVENYSNPITFQGKTADLLTQIDISAKMNAEQKVQSSEQKYRHLYENSPNAILLFNLNGEILDCNLISEELSGFNRDDLIGKNLRNLNAIPRSALPIVLEDLRALVKGIVMKPREIQLHTKEGALLWVNIQASLFDYENEKVIQAIIQVIDEKKKAEQELKESEAKYHELFETSPDGVILTDLKGNIIECNSAIKSIAGYSPTEFIGKNFINLNIYPENGLEKLLEGYKDLLEDNKLGTMEFPIKHKDNQINWVQVRSTLINMKGQKYILAVIHNVTTQKEAEETIKRSEKRYRDILETSSVGVIELDLIKNQIKYMNPKLIEIIGYKENELTENHFLNKLIHPKDLRKLLDSNEKSELEFRIFDKFGKLKWLSGKTIPRFNENGQIISIRVWLEDITEKKSYETLIYELNVNFLNFTADIRNNIQLLLNTCLNLLNSDFVLYINKTEHEGKETFQILTSDNKSFMCDTEFFVEKLFVSELFYESHDFPQTFYDINKIDFANRDPFIARYNLKGCFGKLIKSHNDLESAVCVFYKQNPVISNQDKLVMFLLCDAIEIEQRRWQVQRGLEEQNITLNKINNLKSELFSRTSHELKTPLISIKGFTELLLTFHKPKFDNEVLSILEEIKEGSKRLEKIINLLLESTKLEAEQLELSLSNENLSFLIRFCVKELRGLTKLRNQSITLKLHDTLETQFDKERIYEVFSNLLVNAIKYTPPGGKITIESAIKGGLYLISVKDDGIGFTPEERDQAFMQFGKIERYGQGWDVAIEGTGLGLYITKKLIELHGGKIWLESEGRNKGSTFYFTIPIKN